MQKTWKLALVCALLVAPILADTETSKREENQEQLRQEELGTEKKHREEDRAKEELRQRPSLVEKDKDRDEWQQQQVELSQQEERREEEPLRQQQVELQASKGGLLRPFVPVAETLKGEAEPYAFGYSIDGSSRSESGDSRGVVRGQYTLQGADGSSRVVDYVADHNGFRASINTNEFGTEPKAPANVALRTSQPLAEEITLRQQAEVVPQLAAEGRKGGPEWVQPLLPSPPPPPATPILSEKLEQSWSKTSQKREEEPVKGPLKAVTRAEQLPVLKEEEPITKLEEPIKARSAELKQLPAQHRSSSSASLAAPVRGFESATAHRRPQPRPLVRAYQPAALVRGRPVEVRPVYDAASPTGYRRRVQQPPPSPAQQHRRYRPAAVEPRPYFYSSGEADE